MSSSSSTEWSEWNSQRNAAQLILGCYHKSVVESLPDMMQFFIQSVQGISSTHLKEEYLFNLAVKLDVLIANQVDPITETTSAFPMGTDTFLCGVIASVQRDFREETDLTRKASLILQELARPGGFYVKRIEHHADYFTLLDQDMQKQFILPMVFGANAPITAKDVQEVNMCFPDDETKCMKLVNAFSGAAESKSKDAIAITLNPKPAMNGVVFYNRLCDLVNTSPGLLLRALSTLGFMGPQFFRRTSMFLPSDCAYPFGTKSLPLAFAEWFHGIVERPSLKKRA
jgi:hypothetical protein